MAKQLNGVTLNTPASDPNVAAGNGFTMGATPSWSGGGTPEDVYLWWQYSTSSGGPYNNIPTSGGDLTISGGSNPTGPYNTESQEEQVTITANNAGTYYVHVGAGDDAVTIDQEDGNQVVTVTGTVNRTADFLSSAGSTFEPTPLPGLVSRTADFLSATNSTFEPTVVSITNRTADFLSSAGSTFEPSTTGLLNRTADFLSATSSSFEPTVSIVAASSVQSYPNPQSVLLREPRLLVPRLKPLGPVRVNYVHPLTRKLLSFHLLTSTLNLANGRLGSFLGNAYIRGQDGLILDGTGDQLIIDSTTRSAWTLGTSDFTIIVSFVWQTPTSSFPALVSNGDTGTGEWMFRNVSGNEINFYGVTNAINAAATHVPSAGTRYVYTADRRGSTVTVNARNERGVIAATGSDTTASFNMSGSDSYAGIGGAANTSTRWFKGSIDYVGVWGRALLEDEVRNVIDDPYQFLVPA